VRAAALVAVILGSVVPAAALKIDISAQDVDRALTIARSREHERAGFHAPYIQQINTPFVERAELVTEFRRVVLLAEERAAKGDRYPGYSVTSATEALKVWRRRVSVLARVRFHPQNNYVTVPAVEMALVGNDRALIGVLRDPVLSLSSGRKGESSSVLGAVIEGVFEADALGQAPREFVISLEKKELGRVTFDLARLD
jgi:hypothetical protein